MSASAHIVIVDDSVITRDQTRLILEGAGFRVSEVENSADVSMSLWNDPADLVLLDVTMPLMSGDAVVQKLRKNGEQGKVVLYSALPEEQLKKLSEQCGSDGYILKAEDADEIIAQVRAKLG